MTPERIKLFTELVQEVLTTDSGFIPKPVWVLIQKLVPLPAIELILQKGNQFLLTYRKDEYWDGWHIPGGFVMRKESLHEAANRIAKGELGIGGVLNLKQIAVKKLRNHPYGGSPVAIVLVGQQVGEIVETEKIRFFDHIPQPMVADHAEYLEIFFGYLNNQEAFSRVLA
ncbi:MAG: NUDIX domain-containing protein [Candidatus Paceibacterota bacterium]|jgi:ADP-ribose pyrophosphatase YjhB (NUDIX family)